jgi:exonuclease VII large subunit
MALALLTWTRSKATQGSLDVERAAHRLRAALPDPSRERERVAALLRHAQTAVARTLEQRVERLNGFALQLRSLDPRRTLARGYAVVQLREDRAGPPARRKAITSVRQVKGRDRLNVHVKDGHFPAEVSRQYGF